MKPGSLLAASFLRLVVFAPLLLSLPSVGRAQMTATATYTTDNGGNLGSSQKMIAIGADGYTRFILAEDSGSPNYEPQLTYVRCLDLPCDTYNTKSWPIDDLSPFGFSLAIGPDGYARIAYQLWELVEDGAGNYHHGILGLIQCADADCGSSTNNSFIDYAADQGIASVAVGSDGTAYIAYDNGSIDTGPEGIGLATCSGTSCSTSGIATGIDVNDFTWAAIAIGSDGNPVIAYADLLSSDDYASSSGHYYENGTDVAVTDDAAYTTDLAIGPDGFARVLFGTNDNTSGVNFVECTNAACSSSAISTISVPGVIGSVAVGADGNARMEVDPGVVGSSGYSTYYVQCTAADCSSYGTQEISAVAGDSAGLTSLVMGPNNTATMIAQDTNGVIYEAVWLIPSALSVLSVNVLPTGSSGDYGCLPSADYGLMVDIKYQVLDQNGHALQSSPIMMMEPQESGTYWNGIPYAGDIGGTRISTSSQYTASDGTFHDAPFGVCQNVPFATGQTLNATQTIQIAIASAIGSPFIVRDQSFTLSDTAGATGFDHGSITNGSDIMATR